MRTVVALAKSVVVLIMKTIVTIIVVFNETKCELTITNEPYLLVTFASK